MTTGTKQATGVQRLSKGDLKPLAALIDHLGLTPHFSGDALLDGADPVIRSPHHLGEASGMAQLLIGIAGAAIWHTSTDKNTDIAIDIIDAPPLSFSNLDLPGKSSLTPYGADVPEWQDSTKTLT